MYTNEEGILTTTLKSHLESGAGIVLSIFSYESKKGHIVRLQEITSKGLIVDDPYGDISSHMKARESGESGYRKKGTGSYDNRNSEDDTKIKGEENLQDTEIKYAVIFDKN